ncbi:MAG: hypothetical protein PHE24_05050 [Patescibacteria group bacterium]|nr:hypothetical protein [Patescibacteria group bacterium]
MKLFFDCERTVSSALWRALSAIIDKKGSLIVTNSREKADLILVDQQRKIGGEYDATRTYVIINIPGTTEKGIEKDKLPANVKLFQFGSVVAEMATLIGKMSAKVIDQPDKEMEGIISHPKKVNHHLKNILVIDDSRKNLIKAAEQLSGKNNLWLANGLEAALEIISKSNLDFYAVLCDLYLPMSPMTLSPQAFKPGQLVPYGMPLIFICSTCPVARIAIVTDISHHNDPISATFDLLSGKTFLLDGTTVKFLHARLDEKGAKDWLWALESLENI